MSEKYTTVQYVSVSDEDTGRRIDNFLFTRFKSVPKTRIYRMLRKGEVRLNGSRVKQDRKLQSGDVVRIPPVHMDIQDKAMPPGYLVQRLLDNIIYEDDKILVVNKPGGISVHSGSRDPYGVIEALRSARQDNANLQLAHRLDRMTSGCLLFSKRNDVLRELHSAFRRGQINKKYLALVMGKPGANSFHVDLPLKKGTLISGERMVQVDNSGKQAQSNFHVKKQFKTAALMEVELLTGRTHQIRVHASHAGHPLAMDKKYGRPEFNRQMKELGLKRMFLHASCLEFRLTKMKKPMQIKADLPDDLKNILTVHGL